MARILTVLVGMVGVGIGIDWVWDLEGWVRRCALAAYPAAALIGGWIWILKPCRRVPSGDRLALHMERREPALRSRLISAVQLVQNRSETERIFEKSFVERLVRETENEVGRIALDQIAPADDWIRSAKVLAAAIGTATVFWFWGGATSSVLLRRVFGADVPLPRETRIVEVTGDQVMARGEDLLVWVRVEGVIPKRGELVLQSGTGKLRKLPLERAEDRPGRFEKSLVNLTADLRYRIRVNDAESSEFSVEVVPRPVVTNLDLALEYPAYTGLPTRRIGITDLNLLRGSRLHLAGHASQPLERALARLAGLEREVALASVAGNPSRFGASLLADDPSWTGVSFRLRDRRGIESSDPAVYPVQVVEDSAPAVRVTLPARREELVTPRGTVLVAFEAKDDFGLADLRLVYQPASGVETNATPRALEMELAGEVTNVIRRRFEWKLAGLRPPVREGAFLEFWVEARDRREIGGPGVGRSERYLARVVSESEKRMDLLTRAGDAIGRLGDVARGQERLNESLGRIILEKAPPR